MLAEHVDTPLTDMQARFVENYARCMVLKDAAIAAGYSKHTAGVQAQQLIAKPHVAAELHRIQHEQSKRNRVNADRVIQEFAGIAFNNPIDYFKIDEDTGLPVLKKIHELTRTQAAAIEKMSVVVHPDTQVATTYYTFASKTKALDSLAKMLGLFAEDNRQKGAALGGALAGGIAMLKLDDFSPEERDFIRQMAERRAKVLEQKSADDAAQIEDIEPDA